MYRIDDKSSVSRIRQIVSNKLIDTIKFSHINTQ